MNLLVHYFSIFGFTRLPSSVVLFFFLIFFFKFALLMTVPQSAHLCDANEHLQLCTDLMGLL